MNIPIVLSARPSSWTSYVLLVALVTACAIGLAFAMWSLPDERPLLLVLGAPTVVYFQIARHFGVGAALLVCTFVVYFAIILLPPFLFGCRSKRRLVFLFAGMGFIHLALGFAITVGVHGLHL
jgi:hypothetical protein